MATTAKRCVPAATLTEVLSVLLPDAVYFFAPSIQSCMLERDPVTVATACTCTGELTVEPLVGAQMWTPADDGAPHAAVPTVKLNTDACR